MSDADDLRRQDDRLMGQLVQKIDDLAADVREVKSSIKWQNGRVRTLEQWRFGLVMAWTVMGVVFGFLAWLFDHQMAVVSALKLPISGVP